MGHHAVVKHSIASSKDHLVAGSHTLGRHFRRHGGIWAAVAGGAALTLAVGWLVEREVRRRSALFPVGGTYASADITGRELVNGTSIRFTFSEGWMHAYAGGNHMSGTTAMVGTRLYWSEEAATEVGCLPGLALQDAWLSAWLNSGVDVFRDHKQWVFSGRGITLVMKSLKDDED